MESSTTLGDVVHHTIARNEMAVVDQARDRQVLLIRETLHMLLLSENQSCIIEMGEPGVARMLGGYSQSRETETTPVNIVIFIYRALLRLRMWLPVHFASRLFPW